MPIDPQRMLTELRELRALTEDANGAQRVAFSPLWCTARAWLRKKFEQLPVEVHQDEAGNLWATLEGESKDALIIGGHIDSVPNGGWLDGCLDTLAGLEVLRRIANESKGRPPITVRLVDWADEEGARFGVSLFGSSLCAGLADPAALAGLRDRDGVTLPEALQAVGIDFARVAECRRELAHAAAYLELHIEQGPVLLDRGVPLGAVIGTFGVERHVITFRGEAAHSGSTPMARRRDALLPAAQLAQEIYRIAERHSGVCTIGACATEPGIPTSVVAECRVTLDQRHLDPQRLAAMLADAREASERFARDARVELSWKPLVRLPPAPFHPELVAACDSAIVATCGRSHRLPSGPLHDATAMARAGVPTAMLFVQSLRGISHNRVEDTREEDLVAAVTALDRLAENVLGRLAQGAHFAPQTHSTAAA